MNNKLNEVVKKIKNLSFEINKCDPELKNAINEKVRVMSSRVILEIYDYYLCEKYKKIHCGDLLPFPPIS